MEDSRLNSLLEDKKVYIFLALACLLVYANSLGGDFVFDDTMQIAGNPALHSWRNFANAFTTDVWAFERETGTPNVPLPYYRPLFTVYLTAGYQLFGLWQQGWHLLNLAVHICATIFSYRLFLRLSAGSTRLSFVAALFFALIPVHVESISWISGIPDPLAALFYIPSLILYIRWRENKAKKFLAYSVLTFFFALLCKETPIVLPLILLTWELTLNRQKESAVKFFAALKNVWIFAAPVAVYLMMRFAMLGKVTWKHPFAAQTPTEFIYATIPYAFVSYLKHIIFPFNLSLIYATGFVEGFGDLNLWIPVLILLGSGALMYVFRKSFTPLMWMAIGLFIAPLAPVLNLQVFHYEYTVQDRYLYLPSIGFVLFVGCLLEKLWTAENRVFRRAAGGAALILCLAYAAGTILQNRVWQSAVSLWSRAVETKPDSWASNYNLGLARYRSGDYEAAVAALNDSLKYPSFDRSDGLIYNNRGLAEQGLGRRDEARKDFARALEINPRSLEANINLGALSFDENRFAEAAAYFKNALQIKPSDASANYNFARTEARLERHADALGIYEKLLQTDRQNAELMYYAAISREALGQKEQAANLLNDAFRFAADEKLKKQIAGELQKLNR